MQYGVPKEKCLRAIVIKSKHIVHSITYDLYNSIVAMGDMPSPFLFSERCIEGNMHE